MDWKEKTKTGESAIDRLFNKLNALYISTWSRQFTSPEDMAVCAECWAEELNDQGITFDEAKIGIDKCAEVYTDYHPTFTQFLEACRPSLKPEVLHESPKRKGREHSEVAKRELKKIYEILNSEPKWKRELKARGMTIDENIPGLKHASNHAVGAFETNKG